MDSSLLRQPHMMSRDGLDTSSGYSGSFLSMSGPDKQALQAYDAELQSLRSKLQIETKHRHQLAERCDQLEAMLISQRENIIRLERCLHLVQSQVEQGGKQQPQQQSQKQPQHTKTQQSNAQPATTIELTLSKLNGSYGLTLAGGRKSTVRWLYVHSVHKDGFAAKEGSIRPGDRVLEINSLSTDDLTNTEAEEELYRLDRARIKLSREPGFVLSLKHQGVNLDKEPVDEIPVISTSPSRDASHAADFDIRQAQSQRAARAGALASLSVNTMHARDANKAGARLHQKHKALPSSPKRRVTFATSARSKIFEQEDSKLPDDSFCVPLQPADIAPPSPGVRVAQLDDLSSSFTSQASADTDDEADQSVDDVVDVPEKMQGLFEECKQSCPGFAVKCVRLEKLAHENTLGISICSRIQNSNSNSNNNSNSNSNGAANDSDCTDIGPYIVSIRAGGPAARSNKIKLEDQLLAVDEQDVRYMDTRDVITFLQETESVVHLIVARKKSRKHANGSSPQTML